jgi:Fe-S-cluster containining protein
MRFKCDKCGLCCRMIRGTPLEKWARNDGSCKHLTKDNLCDIYAKRPTICNVRRLWEAQFSKTVTWERWLHLQEESCKIIKEKGRSG